MNGSKPPFTVAFLLSPPHALPTMLRLFVCAESDIWPQTPSFMEPLVLSNIKRLSTILDTLLAQLKGKKVVAVAWNDAHYDTDEVEEKDHLHRPWQYVTVGVLIKSDEEGVSVSSDVGEDGKRRSRNMIPREMIVEEWTVGVLRRPPKKKKPVAEQQASDETKAA